MYICKQNHFTQHFMRKIILSIYLLVLTFYCVGQVNSSSGKVYSNFSGIDYVFVFNGITASTEITYQGNGTAINWYKFSNPTASISNQNFISPENATGYTLDVDGKLTRIWVIDYQKYLPTLTSIEPENNPTSQCQELKLFINANVPSISYTTYSGVNHIIPREFSINYQTLKWNDAKTSWLPLDTISPIVLPATQKTIPTPYCNTIFKLKGDQFASDLNISPDTVSSSLYITNAVICKATSVVTIRDAKNEAEHPSQATQLTGSAPLDIQFLSNANEPVAQFYNWTIYKGTDLIINRKDKDHRYSFTDAGTFKVKVTASNGTCSYSDSLTVTVSISQIQVPNVFTPNGDGFNDEFRVAYKSIVKFQCWVYNRWGRQVYYWTDPTKGWDGKINGVDAKPGAYFYVIKAYGSDYDPNSKPNPTTHERTGEKIRKGDINLLRGVQ